MKDKKTFESNASNDNSKYSRKKYDESDYNTDYTGKLLADHYLSKVRKDSEREEKLKNEEIKLNEYSKIKEENVKQDTISSKFQNEKYEDKESIEKPIYRQWRFWLLLIFALVIWYTFGFN